MAPPRPLRLALVLAGGGARGAYEVGVAQHVAEGVARELGRPIAFDVFSGTSVGAINACALAARADEPRLAADALARAWLDLEVSDIVHPSGREVWAAVLALFGASAAGSEGEAARAGGVFQPTGLARVVSSTIPFHRIGELLRARELAAVTISTTHVASGRTIVFVQHGERELPPWSRDPTVEPRAGELGAPHVLASAAIPLLFPAVRIAGELYCDGGLRMNVPLSPARRLGAGAMLVVNPRHLAVEPPSPEVGRAREAAASGPLFLLGKALNALALDRIDADVDRLERINAILDAGTRRFGETFVDELNVELGHDAGRGVRPLRTVLVRASQDIARLAAEFARSPLFAKRNRGVVGSMIVRLAEGESAVESDLLSYLLFDGEFARQLIELGRADAAARHEELCALVEPYVRARNDGGSG